jgi:hypothetical protein
MLDTIHLQLGSINIRSNADLIVTPGNINLANGEITETELFQDNNGRIYKGARAKRNAERLNVTIKPYGGTVHAYANFSVPKRINANNYSPIKASDLSNAFESVETELAEAGIETDISEAKVTRLDTFRNILTDEETVTYSRLFGLLNASRTTDKSIFGGTTWLMKNTVAQYCIYDKREEMKFHNESVEALPKTLRFEHRCLGSNKVNSFLDRKLTTVQDIKNYGWKALQDKSTTTWLDNFFKYEVPEVEIMAESQVRTEMQYFQANYGVRWLDKFLKAYGAFHLATSAGGIGVIEKALDNMEVDRMKKHRTKKILAEAKLLMESLRLDETSPKTLGELYAELKYKMMKSA